MKRVFELGVAASLAIAIHIVAFASAPQSGAEATGAGGEAVVSLQGAAPTIVEMVQTWERAPEPIVDITTELKPDMPATAPPMMPQLETAAPRAEVRLATLQDVPSEQLNIDPAATAAPPPPPKEEEPIPEPEPPIKTVKEEPKPQVERAKKAAVTSAGRQEQRAAGGGGGAQAGRTATSAMSTAEKGKQASLTAVWGAKIRNKILRFQRYPRGKHGNGTVVLRIRVARSGHITGTQVLRSSGVAALDKAAVATVKSAKRGPKAPKALQGETFNFVISLIFTQK
jgi:protein TonB